MAPVVLPFQGEADHNLTLKDFISSISCHYLQTSWKHRLAYHMVMTLYYGSYYTTCVNAGVKVWYGMCSYGQFSL